MAIRLKLLKNKIMEWVKENFGEARVQKLNIPAEIQVIQALDWKEENDHLTLEEEKERLDLKEDFQKKIRGGNKVETKVEMQMVEGMGQKYEDFPWEGFFEKDKSNLPHFGWSEKIEGERGDNSSHRRDYFSSLYVDEGWERRSLDKLVFDATGEQKAQWLERKFEEDEVCQAVDLAGVEVRQAQMGLQWPSFNAFRRC